MGNEISCPPGIWWLEFDSDVHYLHQAWRLVLPELLFEGVTIMCTG